MASIADCFLEIIVKVFKVLEKVSMRKFNRLTIRVTFPLNMGNNLLK